MKILINFTIAIAGVLFWTSCRNDVVPASPQWMRISGIEDSIKEMTILNDKCLISTQDNGFIVVDVNDFSFVRYNTTNSHLWENVINSVATDESGGIWVGTFRYGLWRYHNNIWNHFHILNSALPDNSVRSIAIDQNNKILIGTWNGLATYDGSQWKTYNVNNSPLPDNKIRKIAVSPTGDIYVGTHEGGLIKKEASQWIIYNATNSNLSDNQIRFIKFDLAGNLWTASYEKFYKRENNKFNVMDESNTGISSPYVNDIAFQGERIYYATHHGFTVFRDNTWHRYYAENSELPHNIVDAVAVDKNGNKWIGTFGGLVIYNEEGVKY